MLPDPIKAYGRSWEVQTRKTSRGHQGIVVITNGTRFAIRSSCERRHLEQGPAIADATAYRDLLLEEAKKHPRTFKEARNVP